MKITWEQRVIMHELEEYEQHRNVDFIDEQKNIVRLFGTLEENEFVIKDVSSTFGLWHKKEVIQNVLSHALYDSDNKEFREHFGKFEYRYRDLPFDKEDLSARYLFLTSLLMIDEWMRSKFFIKKSDDTKDTYRRSIRVFFQFLIDHRSNPSSFDIQDVVAFFRHQEKMRKSTYYINKLYFALLQYVRAMVPDMEQDYFDWIQVTAPPNLLEISPKRLEQDVLDKLSKYLSDSIMNATTNLQKYERIRNAVIVTLFFETGMRLSELGYLDIQDIRNGEVTVRGKGNKERTIPLSTIAKNGLKGYHEQRDWFISHYKIPKKDADPLFFSNQKRRLSTRSIARIFDNIEGLHPHLSRHTLISKMVRRGTDLPTIMAISGHSSMDMVARYSKPSKADILRAIEGKDNE